MFFDYCLKFPDEETCVSVLFDMVDSTPISKYDAIDIIGVINIGTGVTIIVDEQDFEIMTPAEGFHANIRHSSEITELNEWIVIPKSPQRVWF